MKIIHTVLAAALLAAPPALADFNDKNPVTATSAARCSSCGKPAGSSSA